MRMATTASQCSCGIARVAVLVWQCSCGSARVAVPCDVCVRARVCVCVVLCVIVRLPLLLSRILSTSFFPLLCVLCANANTKRRFLPLLLLLPYCFFLVPHSFIPQVLRRAFEAAKAGARGEYTTSPNAAGGGYDKEPWRVRDRAAPLERAEFRLFLLYLKRCVGRERERESGRERKRESVCVCVCESV